MGARTVADGPGEVAEVEPEVGGPLFPLAPQCVDGDGAVLVRSIGVERRRRRARARRCDPRSLPVLVHGGRSLGEEPAQPGVDTDDVAHSGRTQRPCRPHAITQLVPQACVVEGLGRPEMGVQSTAVHTGPHPVHPFGHIGHHHMGVQVGIEGPAGAVEELTGHRAGGGEEGQLVLTPASHPYSFASQVVEGVGHRPVVTGPGRFGDLPRCQQMEKADRLGGTEGEVVPGHAALATGGPQAPTRGRVTSLQHLGEGGRGDRTGQSQRCGPGTHPRSGLLAGHPAALGPAGDQIVHVVVVAALTDDVDLEYHRGPPPTDGTD